MIRLTLLFGERQKIKKAASASNYNGHRLHLRRKPNWLYCLDKGPLFTVACTLWLFGLYEKRQGLSEWDSLVEEAKKYRCYFVHSYCSADEIVCEIGEQNAA